MQSELSTMTHSVSQEILALVVLSVSAWSAAWSRLVSECKYLILKIVSCSSYGYMLKERKKPSWSCCAEVFSSCSPYDCFSCWTHLVNTQTDRVSVSLCRGELIGLNFELKSLRSYLRAAPMTPQTVSCTLSLSLSWCYGLSHHSWWLLIKSILDTTGFGHKI